MLSEQAKRKRDELLLEYCQGSQSATEFFLIAFNLGHEAATKEAQVLETRITILRKALEYYAHGAPRVYVEKAQIKGGIVFLGKEFEARAIEALFVDDKLVVRCFDWTDAIIKENEELRQANERLLEALIEARRHLFANSKAEQDADKAIAAANPAPRNVVGSKE